jgi:hypothetical protein
MRAPLGQEPASVRVLSCRTTLFNPPEFIPTEAMGTELPRRCPACRNCKEYQFRMDSLTFEENTEYEVILSKLHLDVERKQWIAGYPFNTLVEKLVDNYGQARGCMSRMETRLLKKGRLGEFTGTSRTMWTGECSSPSPGRRLTNTREPLTTSAWWRRSRPARSPLPHSGSS